MTVSSSGTARATQSGLRGVLQDLAVRAEGLEHRFGDGDLEKQVLFDNNLEIPRGELVIMTGPSGSGKTTLLTLIGALRTVQTGRLDVLNQPLRGASPAQLLAVRRRLGFIFQHHNLFASLTAAQNVAMAAQVAGLDRREARRRISELLERMGLGRRMNYKPGQLSGGQKQRVAVARALVHEPELILADEPTAALDREAGRTVITLLREMAEQRAATVIVVTHDNRILDFADRMVSMVDGRIASNVMVKEAEKICQYLRTSAIFSETAVTTLSRVADRMLVERFDAGRVVIRQGDPGEKFYLIRSGEVEVVVEDERGRRVINRLAEGAYFGETALLTDEPRNATIVTTSPCVFYTLEKSDFREAVSSSPNFEDELRRAIFDRH